MAASYSEEYFGGVEQVRIRLASAVKTAREARQYSQTYLDTVCGFGTVLNRKKIKLPTCAEFENDPNMHMNSLVFSLASFPLDLKIDAVLPIALTERDKTQIATEMKTQGARAIRGAGGGDVKTIPLSEQAGVYVITKILAEVDKDMVLTEGTKPDDQRNKPKSRHSARPK